MKVAIALLCLVAAVEIVQCAPNFEDLRAKAKNLEELRTKIQQLKELSAAKRSKGEKADETQKAVRGGLFPFFLLFCF